MPILAIDRIDRVDDAGFASWLVRFELHGIQDELIFTTPTMRPVPIGGDEWELRPADESLKALIENEIAALDSVYSVMAARGIKPRPQPVAPPVKESDTIKDSPLIRGLIEAKPLDGKAAKK